MAKTKKTSSKASLSSKQKRSSSRGQKTPKTMEELLSFYGSKIRTYAKGERVKGKVVEKRSRTLVLDIGGKSEGIVAENAFEEAKSYIDTLKVGDEVEGKVIIPETPDGFVIISLREATQSASWKSLSEAKRKGAEIKSTVKAVNPSGAIVEVSGLTGFIPNSHLGKEVSKDTQSLIGRTILVKVIEIEKEGNRVILSERAVSESEDIELKKDAIEAAKEGEVYQGKVVKVSNFGVFVEITLPSGKKKVPVEGLVHVSEMAWEKVENPKDILEKGDAVQVKVIGTREGKLALSMKQAQKDPWEEIAKKYETDKKIKGKVTKVSDFGVFVELEPGVEGLIHITKIPPGENYEKGKEVSATIEEIDGKERRISLSPVLTAKPVGYK